MTKTTRKENRLARKAQKKKQEEVTVKPELTRKERALIAFKEAEKIIERDRIEAAKRKEDRERKEEEAIKKGLRNREITVCVTGNRPQKVQWLFDRKSKECRLLAKYMYALVEKLLFNGYRNFMSGMALGIDTMFAEAVLKLKKKYNKKCENINLICVLACKNQSKPWRQADKEKLNKIIDKADEVVTLSQRYTPTCYFIRNEYMVDNSNLVEAFWDYQKTGGTYSTIKYGEKQGVLCNITNLNRFIGDKNE